MKTHLQPYARVKKIFAISFILLSSLAQWPNAYAQQEEAPTDSIYQPRLILDFPLIDYPYLQSAAQTSANHRLNQMAGASGAANAGDYLRGYNSPSMRQATAIAKDIHTTSYYFQNLLWNRLVKPTNWKRKLLKRLGANITAIPIDYLFTKLPLGVGWSHEEYHRNAMTQRGISSYNDFWLLAGLKSLDVSVSQVKDEDLVWFKANHPAEIVRMNSAGTEAEYVFIQAMQKDNFFHQTNYPNIALSILLTQHAVDYANSASDRTSTIPYIEEIQKQGPDISKRDFTGNDFTAWTYDLFRPQEPYEARGIHPSGNGIRRDRTPGDLTDEEISYAQKVGKLQYFNFISPHLLGINRIKVSKNFAFNFAARHYLTSFGYDLGGDLFLKIKDKHILFSWHGYHNKDHFFPGVEAQLLDLPLKRTNNILTLRTMLWLQPNNQEFYTSQAQAGGLLAAQLRFPVGKTWQPYLEVEGKTQGWVAGNPFLRPNISVRAGISAYINFQRH